ncbi:hypothetical protein [Curtobacterium sp. VKM Ac-2922]|uniref:hypothetical protein n=1 Tax=Curtobacterium sp. VKM Ac-2922 TaxID=2929475 RepID=UPI001FB24D85|nr:hypothetical protein [Curtobacterium sp. VKM Ac-2922]MCJ1712977.1 hypothetical protein [Curtobacterium sp. VKM Ac-2922]
MDTVDSTWSRLRAAGVYETPESVHVHDAMSGPRQATDVIAQDAANARRALHTYATTLATLATQRAALVQDIGKANDAAAVAATDADADLTSNSNTATGLLDRISTFNTAVATADGDCAATLRRLSRYTQHQLGDAAKALNTTLGAGGAMGLAAGIMSNYDDLKDAVIAELQVRRLLAPSGRRVASQATGGIEGQAKRGRALPGSQSIENAGPRHLAGPDDLEGLSKVMRSGGKALGAVGVVATVGGAYIDSYESTSAAHPEWSETHRNLKATEHAVVTGGVSAAGGVAGGIMGAQIGASIGSIVPGVGTVAGGLIGGLVGGIIGSGVGEKMGEGAERFMDDLFHW